MSTGAMMYRSYELPWTYLDFDHAKFKRLLKKIGIPVLVLALILPFLPSYKYEYDKTPPPPPDRIAQLIIDKPLPPPPVVAPKPVEKPKNNTKKIKVKPQPKPKPKPQPVAPQPEVKQPVVDVREQARERASKAGVLAVQDQLAAVRDVAAISSLNKTSNSAGSSESGRSTRNLVVSNNPSSRRSGGINTSALSQGTGGSGLGTRETSQVASPVQVAASQGSNARARTAASNSAGTRSREEIEQIFDQNKAAIYAIYNRALRKDPTLEGKVVLELTIAPSGQVTACKIVSSELGDSGLESKLVSRVKLFNFGAKEVDTVVTTKPIDFFPA